jgi:hypothetical protein
MLALLRQAWLTYPDQRLGQIIGNAARDPLTDEVSRSFQRGGRDELWVALKRMTDA